MSGLAYDTWQNYKQWTWFYFIFLCFLFYFSYYIYIYIFYFSLFLDLDKRCDVTLYVTATTYNRDIISITVTQLYDIKKDIQDSKIDSIVIIC